MCERFFFAVQSFVCREGEIAKPAAKIKHMPMEVGQRHFLECVQLQRIAFRRAAKLLVEEGDAAVFSHGLIARGSLERCWARRDLHKMRTASVAYAVCCLLHKCAPVRVPAALTASRDVQDPNRPRAALMPGPARELPRDQLTRRRERPSLVPRGYRRVTGTSVASTRRRTSRCQLLLGLAG